MAAGERTLILAEGFSGDPHYGKTMRGVLRYRREDVVAILDSTRADEEPRRRPDRRRRRVGPVVRAPGRARRRRDAGRTVPTGVACAPGGVHPERALPGERSPPDASGRSRAASARQPARRRAARPAAAARRPRLPDGREPRGRRADRAHRRLRLRDRQDDRLAGARPRSACARDRLGLRAHRSDRDRDRRLGHRRGRCGLGLSRRRRGAPRRRGARAGRGAPARGGSGLSRASRVLRRDARPLPRLRAARARPLPSPRHHGGRGLPGASRCRPSPSSSRCTSRSPWPADPQEWRRSR